MFSLDQAVRHLVSSEADISIVVQYYYPPRFQIESREESILHGNERDHLGYSSSRLLFQKILQTLFCHVGTFTVFCEEFHVDPNYRDSYYSYFSNQHFNISRFSRRLTFFLGDWLVPNVFSARYAEALGKSFLGTCVIYPTEAQTIGRVLFDPRYLVEYPCTLRTTKYSITVYGIRLKVCAFPFQMQDRETTRCAEVTLLNILDYYGNSYSDYRAYKPSEIIAVEEKFNADRTLPARGSNYFTMSKLLTTFGFKPRLYGRDAMVDLEGSADDEEANDRKDVQIHRILHYYIESGIPVATNVAVRGNYNIPGHSIICIGYAEKGNGLDTTDVETWNEEKAFTLGDQISDGPRLINSADYYGKYVVIDDNQLPYSIRRFEELSLHEGLQVEYLLVPLYKRMFLEAADAYDVVVSVLKDSRLGLMSRVSEKDLDESIVIRLFLASSRTFKNFRIMNGDMQQQWYRDLYGAMPLPRFVWVAELYKKSVYEDQGDMAFGEIVLDATSATKSDIKSVIMVNYPEAISVRAPDEPIQVLNQIVKGVTLKPFPKFIGNLRSIEPSISETL